MEGRNLFCPIDLARSQYVLPVAIAQYISVLGPPPLWMIQESENPFISTFFDDEGEFRTRPVDAGYFSNSVQDDGFPKSLSRSFRLRIG